MLYDPDHLPSCLKDKLFFRGIVMSNSNQSWHIGLLSLGHRFGPLVLFRGLHNLHMAANSLKKVKKWDNLKFKFE